MRTSSPLRYPGGKSAMAGLLSQARKINGLGSRAIAEPFAGGAGASLSLLYMEEAPEIFINDADPAIHAFWMSVTEDSRSFIEMLSAANVNIEEWQQQRDTYRSRGRVSRLRRGFAAFYLNRCNRSGIIVNGGPIGGVDQTGTWKIDARFNKDDLRRRCEKVAEYKDRIHLSCLDGIEFITKLAKDECLFFIDPPYYDKGRLLYLNSLDHAYHVRLAEQLKSMQEEAWLLTYDDCPEIREMYSDWATIRPFCLRYAAAERRQGTEVLIAPQWLRLPPYQKSAAITW